MQRNQVSRLFIYSILALALALGAVTPVGSEQVATRKPDVLYVPTPPEVVDAMLEVTKVTAKDVVYDLGCGDGRIVITAAKAKGATGIGIDIDPKRIEEATANAREAGVMDRVTFRQEDLFEADISEASVVTLYLLTTLNLKLRPKLWRDLAVGTRVVSHSFSMGDWEAEQTLDIDGRKVYFWTITEEIKKRLAEGQ